MGCECYVIEDTGIKFPDDGDEYGCLCAFPGNYKHGIGASVIRSLALLGAAVVLVNRDEIKGEPWGQNRKRIHLPGSVPDWICKDIDKALGYQIHEPEVSGS